VAFFISVKPIISISQVSSEKVIKHGSFGSQTLLDQAMYKLWYCF